MSSLLDILENLFKTRDLYEILDFPKATINADRKSITENQIKKAYHKSSLKYHPDRAEDAEREDATKKFQALGALYKILSDPDSRALYDESGKVDTENRSINENRDWADFWRLLFQKMSISYDCELCNNSFQCANSLIDHLNAAHRKSSKTLNEKDGYQSVSNENLTEHNHVNHPDIEIPDSLLIADEKKITHKCFHCGKNIKTQNKLRKHIIQMHSLTATKSYVCKDCKRSYVNKYGLDQHNRSKHGLGIRYHCELCKKSFTTIQRLDKHSKIRHNIKKIRISKSKDRIRVNCNKCNNTYSSRSSLRLHVKSKHSESPNYVCWICKKVYSYNVSLINHVNFAHKLQL